MSPRENAATRNGGVEKEKEKEKAKEREEGVKRSYAGHVSHSLQLLAKS